MSNGREACSGSSLYSVVSAPSSEKPSTSHQVVSASNPPASIIFVSPSWISRKASPSACADAVQAVLTPITGPPAPASRAVSSAAVFWLSYSVFVAGKRCSSWPSLARRTANASENSCSSGRPTEPPIATPMSSGS